MTREKMKELLPVAQAYAEGKTVQWSTKGDPFWSDFTGDTYDARSGEQVMLFNCNLGWRVKPQPREYWECVVCGFKWVNSTSDGRCRCGASAEQVIHWREVVE